MAEQGWRARQRAVFHGVAVTAICVGSVACGDESEKASPDKPAPVNVGSTAGLMQATADAIWVVTDAGVARIDPESVEVVATVSMLQQPEYIISDGTSVWASLFNANQLVRIDAASDSIADTLEVPENPAGAVVVGDSIWVASHRGAAVLRFETGEPDATATVPVGELGPDGPLGVAAGLNSIWVGTPNIFSVSQIDPSTNSVVAEFGIPPGANPCGDIAVVGGRVQVSSCRVANSISVIDPATGEVQVVEVNGFGVAVAVVDDVAWWAVQVTGSEPASQLVSIDSQSGALRVVTVPGVTAIGGVLVAFGYVWISDEATGTVTRFPMSLLE